MSTIPLPINAAEAERLATGEVRNMNASRMIPAIPARLKRLAKEEKVHIFNVGPWPHMRLLGSLGSFLIQACDEGKEYSEPLILDGIIFEPYPIDETKMAFHEEEGSFIAEQILGIGKHLDPRASFVKYGVFIAAGPKPTKAELEKAKTALRDHYKELVLEADRAFAQGPKAAEETVQPDLHFRAAQVLKLSDADHPWLKVASQGGARENCPGCGNVYNVGVMLCRHCSYILDAEKYAKNKGNFAK